MDLIVKTPKKQVKAWPYIYYRTVLLILALLGLADSIYLAIQHYQVHTDMLHKSFCAISKSINCDTVSQSAYSIFFGVPFAVWGIIAYVFLIVLWWFMKDRGSRSMRIWTYAFLATWVFVAYSLVLFYVSKFLVQSYCIMCIVSYIINFILLFWTGFTLRRFSQVGILNEIWQIFRYLTFFKKPMFPILVVFGIIAICTMVFYPPYWNVKVAPIVDSVARGVGEDGHPWIGAESPDLTIIEYSDYQCFQCRKLHYFLRQLVNMYPEKLRLVHVNFPMDHLINPLVKEPYHVGSAILAAITINAIENGNFWAVNDAIFSMVSEGKQGFTMSELLEVSGLSGPELGAIIGDKTITMKIYRDIVKGLELGIEGTPSFVINGELYEADIPLEYIRMLEKN